tara:strand:- start:44 stop:1078 length:1035 start_codon:yes stop_codon:yes gene_type:complete
MRTTFLKLKEEPMSKSISRRTFSKAVAAAATVTALVTTPAAAQEPIRIAYLSPSFDISDAWEHVFWSLQGRLDELNVPYEIQSLAVATHVAHAEQLAQVEAVITSEFDYVFLGPTEFEAAIPSLKKLKAAGIPTVVYNYTQAHEDEDVQGLQYVGFSHFKGGQLSGAWAASHINGNGKIAILQGAPGIASDQRRDGFLDIINNFDGIEVVMGPYTDFDRTKAFDAAENLLAAHDNIDLIYGVSTTIGLGAGQAVRQKGLSEEIATMGFGGTGDEVTAMAEGWLTASVLRPIDDSGAAVADAFFAHMNGETPDLIWGGAFVMVDNQSDATAIVEYANRYSADNMQ